MAPVTGRTGHPTRLPATPPARRARSGGGLGLLVVALLLAGLFGTGAGLAQLGGGPGLPGVSSLFGSGPRRPSSPALPRSSPTRISIPSIGVVASLEPVGLAADGTIDTPALAKRHTAGWFDQGPTPGEDGPAVIVGHVDTSAGPSVFYKLGKVRPGQRIQVTRRDHRVATFLVDSVQVFNKSQVPADQVYGDFSRPALRVITCGGPWLGGEVGYEDNIIVFATLIS